MHKHLIGLIVGVVIVLAFTVSTYVVFMQFRPDAEWRNMLQTMAQVETLEHNMGISWTRNEPTRVTTTLYTSGPVQVLEGPVIQHDTQFRLVHVSRSDRYKDLSGAWRHVNGTEYITYEAPGPNVDGVTFEEETWVAIPTEDRMSWGAIIPGLNPPVASHLSEAPWSPEALARLQYLLAFMDIMEVEYNGLTELIEGTNTRILDGSIHEDAAFAFMLDLIRAKEGRQPTDEERIQATYLASQLSRFTFRAWVGFQDHYLYRLQAAGAVESTETSDLIPVDVRLDISRINEDVQIDAPEDSTAFETIYRAAFGTLPRTGMSAGATKQLIEASNEQHLPVIVTQTSDDPDNDGLPNILELFYGTSATVADTDGDGMNDGDEVKRGRNPRGTGTLFGFGL